MIELHSSAEGQIAHDPFVRPLDEQLGNFGNPYDTVIELLGRIANFSERQREKVAPDIIDLSPSVGNPIASTFTTKVRMRVDGMLVSGGTGDKFQFSVGTRKFYLFLSGNPTFFRFPYTIQEGNDIAVADLTNPASVGWSWFIFAYPEG